MRKSGRWIKNLFTSSKEKEPEGGGTLNHLKFASLNQNQPLNEIPVPATKEKRKWSFRSSANRKTNLRDHASATPHESKKEEKKHTIAISTDSAAAAEAAMAAAHAAAAAAVIQLSAVTSRTTEVEEAAAIKIQSTYRSHLARKALTALRGLVKLQALVRGYLVRKQATATFRCMQALVTAQARARSHRLMTNEQSRSSVLSRSRNDVRLRQSQDSASIKFVEIEPDGSGTNFRRTSGDSDLIFEGEALRFPTSRCGSRHQFLFSPSLSALTDLSPRASSGHFDDYLFAERRTPQYFSTFSKSDHSRFSFPQDQVHSLSQVHPYCPNYMVNTESSKAKVRSHSAPKQRPDDYEKQSSRRRSSIEGKNLSVGIRMQRSSSHAVSTANGYQYPSSLKLDRSNISFKGSECGSNSFMLADSSFCRSPIGF